MKLYAHPASTTSRPIMMFCAEQGIEVENVTIDLFSGAHKEAPYLAVNPNGMIPAIDDEGFILSESSAILKYLADKIESPTYPKEARARARVEACRAPRRYPYGIGTGEVLEWGVGRRPLLLADGDDLRAVAPSFYGEACDRLRGETP